MRADPNAALFAIVRRSDAVGRSDSDSPVATATVLRPARWWTTVPAWAQAVLTAEPKGRQGGVELVSGSLDPSKPLPTPTPVPTPPIPAPFPT